MVHPHRQHVVAFAEIGCHVVHERRIAVGTLAQQMTVEIHLAAVVHALEVYVVSVGTVGNGKMLAIPTDTARQIACAAGEVGRGRLLHTPVVRQL